MSKQPWEGLITTPRALANHAQLLQRYGGKAGGPKEGCVDGSLGSAYSADLYRSDSEEAQRPGLVFACSCLLYLCQNHCFTDGNKRVAWATFVEVLVAMGLAIQATDDETEGFVLDIAAGKVREVEAVVAWTISRLVDIEDDPMFGKLMAAAS